MLTPTPRAENVILNTPPILTHIPDQIVYAGHAVHFTASATDAEIAVQQLVFSLEPGAPVGASINSANGQFSWPTLNDASPRTNTITVRVTDSANPLLSATQSVVLIVLPPPRLDAQQDTGQLRLSFSTLPGQNYQVQFTDSLTEPAWQPLTPPLPATNTVLQIDAELGMRFRFYRLVVLP
jgi:hypothetical protein